MNKFLVLLFFLATPLLAGEREDAFFKDVEKAIYPENVTYMARMTIYKPGKEYKKLLKVYLKGYDKSLIEFIEPPQERGTRILMIGENSWMYLPSAEKVIRLSGRIRVMGGEFIYDDIMRAKLTIDYILESLEEHDSQKILTLKAKNKKAAYDKIKLYITDSLLPTRSEFYTESGVLLKTLDYSEPVTFLKTKVPSRLLMQLAVSQDHKTLMNLVEYNYSTIPDRVFTQEYLKKGL